MNNQPTKTKERGIYSLFFYVISFKLYDLFIYQSIMKGNGHMKGDLKMRNRINTTTATVYLADENHRINRRAMLMDMLEETLELRSQEDNWIVRDRYTDEISKIEEALDELMRAKVGDELTYCVIY